ncbi:MAG: hypothetical protein B7Y56_07040 [Gallionellales bacterium 35-53-114]|jgi:hypothetical protein|nr:MAG: hypothetical protein B7Y56_07040 [Gallionellales bacterium 35-53-114]OYZ63938.1 MAG: hypothetical protein B7Y04_08135 [Gallionellales bacterium 24-53-125]OZB09233.1 MAG: hypothetical protein B7X61_06075 [Gallionellales bacterium 39-52-133]HQS59167.1 hypothetical protein [Gallionellaceae bacterium]HQS75903.1 hypothetical protein [Gallionellaceae bacterium]
MHLRELIKSHAQAKPAGVPDWMLGFFKRYSISFANGLSDTNTHVCWLQSRNFTIDLRLPIEIDQVLAKPLIDYSAQELQQFANYEGWLATSVWDGRMLSWCDTDISLQLHNRWTEPAILKRVGNCMVEFCPSDVYVEDWRLQPSAPGPLVGLKLLVERELASGRVRHTGGGLIVCGDYAGLVLGRAKPLSNPAGKPLKMLVAEAAGDAAALSHLFAIETSVAKGCLDTGFEVAYSTHAHLLKTQLFPLDGFEYPVQDADYEAEGAMLIRQTLEIDGIVCVRLFTIDTLEAQLDFAQTSATTAEAAAWFDSESPTLTRYTKVLV